MSGRIRGSLAVMFAAAVLLLAAACSLQVESPPPDPDGDPAAYTQAFVAEAIAMYDEQGREATFAHYSSPESAVGQWYLFIVDAEADALVVHPNPALLGAKSAQRRDPRGFLYGPILLSTTEEGQWVSYYYRTYEGERPVAEGQKHAWHVRHDGLIFASGWYENLVPLPTKEDDPAGFTKWFVYEAVNTYDVGGVDALIKKYSDPASVDGDWYIYVLDLEATIIAHPTAPEIVGQSLLGPIGFDLAGTRHGPQFLEVTPAGRWISYYSRNPNSGACELKHAWAVRRGDVIIGSGWYENAAAHPLLPTKCHPIDYTVATVERAVARYRAEGRDAAIDYHNSMASVDGRWYVFIMDVANGVMLAHPAPVYVGHSLLTGSEAYDDAGYFYARDLVEATEEGLFVRDVIGVPTVDEQNPFHTSEEVKHYYAVRADDLIFVSGWYTAAPTKDDPAEYARLLVGRALTRYDDTGPEATLAHYNDPASLDGTWYVWILEDRDGDLYTVANANHPDLVGTTRERIDANDFNYGEAFAAVTETGGGEWVSYLGTHPQTREPTPKHTWVVRRDNYVIGAGWYEGTE